MSSLQDRVKKRMQDQGTPPPGAPPVAPPPTVVPALSGNNDATGDSLQDRVRKRMEAGEESPSKKLPKQIEESFGTMLKNLFTGDDRLTDETRSLREVSQMGGLNTGSLGKNLKIAVGLMASVDPQQQRNIIRNTLPSAVIKTDDKGVTTVDYKGQKFLLNKPGFSPADAQQAIFQLLSFAPASRLVGLGSTLLKKMAIGGAGSALTSGALDILSNIMGSEKGISGERAALAAAFGTLVEPGLAVGAKLREVPEDLVKETTSALREAEKIERRVGVQLTEGQATLLPSQLNAQQVLAELTPSTRIIMKKLKKQDKQVLGAVDDFLRIVAPPEVLSTGSRKLRDTTKRAIAGAKETRRAETNELYNDAFNTADDIQHMINVDDVIDDIDNVLDDFGKGELNTTLKRLKSQLIDAAKPNSKGSNLRRLHNFKVQVAAKIQKLENGGRNPLDPTTKGRLTEVWDKVREKLLRESDEYDMANEKYKELSPVIDKLQDGLIGRISKIKDADLKSVSGRIFDAGETNPEVLIDAKKIIHDIDPSAWNEITRVEIERRMGGMSDIFDEALGTGKFENVPGKMANAIFGNGPRRKVFMNSLDGDVKENAIWLEKALRRAAEGRPGGSRTAGSTEFIKRLKILRGKSIIGAFTSPLDTAGAIASQKAFDRKARAMARLLVDRKWSSEMARLRKMDSKSAKASRLFVQLLSRVEEDDKMTQAMKNAEKLKNAAALKYRVAF